MKTHKVFTVLGFSTKLLSLFFLFLPVTIYAQTWQWGKSGGASDNLSNSSESAKSTCVDSYGNVYLTSDVGQDNLQVGGEVKTTYSTIGRNDGILVSYSCEGNYRWSKVIGGHLGSDIDRVCADALGNVYVAVTAYAVQPNVTQIHFDNDLILPSAQSNVNIHKESVFLVKYDHNGNLLWLRTPQPADVSITESFATRIVDLDVDPQGNSFLMCALQIGTYGNGAYQVTTPGLYILKYDANGVFIGGVDLNVQRADNSYSFKLSRNHTNGYFYIGGKIAQDEFTPKTFINGELTTKTRFVAAFTDTGAFLWKRENAATFILGGNENNDYLCLDPEGNVYYSGTAYLLVDVVGTPPDSFNGIPFVNTGGSPWPYIVKLDPNGNTLWQTNGNRATPTSIIVNGDEVAICGGINNTQWQNLSYQQDTGSGGHPFIARFNKNTGVIIAINPLYSAADDPGSALAIDTKGNYYMGGTLGSSVVVGPNTLNSFGGGSDFYVTKFGSNDCNFLGINENSIDLGIKGYPNPVQDSFYLNNPTLCAYTIYGVLGNEIAKGTLEANGKIDTQLLQSGLYVIRIIDESGLVANLKMVKE